MLDIGFIKYPVSVFVFIQYLFFSLRYPKTAIEDSSIRYHFDS